MERNQVSQDADEQEKLIDNPENNEVQPREMKSDSFTWLYPSGFAFGVSSITFIMTAGFNFLLDNTHAFWLSGPIWIVSLISFAPWIACTLTFNRSLAQLYLTTAGVMLSVWCLTSLFLSTPLLTALGVGAACFVIVALSLHMWAFRFDRTMLVQSGLNWAIRFTCILMFTWYAGFIVFGSRGSLAIHFYSAPFILQPISIFGFGSFEFLVVLTNTVLGWWIFAGVTTRKFLPGSLEGLYKQNSIMRKIFLIVCHPAVFLTITWLLWVIAAGVISVTHVPTTSISFATVNTAADPSVLAYEIEKRLLNGAEYVLTARSLLRESSCNTSTQKCQAVVEEIIAPRIAGNNGYALIGCESKVMSDNQVCQTIDLLFIVSPDGEITTSRSSSGEAAIPHVFNSDLNPDIYFTYLPYSRTYHSDDMTNVAANGANIVFVSSENPSMISSVRVYPHLVISAIENRVGILRASEDGNARVINPLGNMFSGHFTVTSSRIALSYPLQAGWVRQQLPYWIITAACGFFLIMDIFFILSKRRNSHDQ